jgi:hypothetical protein
MRSDGKPVLSSQPLDSQIERSATAGPGAVIKQRRSPERGAREHGGRWTQPREVAGSQRAQSGQHGSGSAGRTLVRDPVPFEKVL